jgi:hypothetical protein
MARLRYGDESDGDGDGDFDTRLDPTLVFTDEEKPLRVASLQLATVRVRVLAPVQIVHNMVVYRPGDVAEIPEAVAADYIRDGWVEPAK